MPSNTGTRQGVHRETAGPRGAPYARDTPRSPGSAAPPVLVLGAGVIGLTSALRLADAGFRVRVWTAARWPDTVSAVAAAIWYPYRAYPVERVAGWARQAFGVFEDLAGDPECGVRMRPGRVLWRDAADDPGLDLIPRESVPILDPAELAGYAFGARTTVPIVEMPVYLPWLERQLAAQGVVVEERAVRSLDEALAACPLVVNCTGIAAREVVGDGSVTPIRGQIVRVENRGLERFTLDVSEGATDVMYMIPRSRDVVLGGTTVPGEWSREPDPAVTRAILERCLAAEPVLREAPVVGVWVGLRPGRPSVRLEAQRIGDAVCIHNYGHGGSGVTVSWGCADDVVELAREAVGLSPGGGVA